ncbi:MAG: hypothetical protein BWY82_01470 [Verrucomicrobia bacterium ADurb.Bin474]|nr:MAG: hypothetical protein BWY82_01470 [Verrucomicrobia bacterium ADurb.Bin474]
MASRRLGIPEGKILEMLGGLKLYDLAGNHEYLSGAVKEPASELAGYFMSQGVLRESPDLPALFSNAYLPAAE